MAWASPGAVPWSVADASTGQFMQRFYALRQSEHLTKAEALRRAQLEFLRGATKAPASPESMPLGDSPTKGLTVRLVGAEPVAPRYTPSPDAPYAHPFYWAPFILLGNGLLPR